MAAAVAVGSASLVFAGATPPPASAAPVVLSQAAPKTCSADNTRGTERWWFFGNSAGLDFGATGSAVPTAVTGAGNSAEGTTVVTDSEGNLQFWSNGAVIYNRNHTAMTGGTFSTGTGASGVANPSATQTVAAFPSTTQPDVYFVVTTTGAENVTAGRLYYTVVDMSLDGGLGAVSQSPVQLGGNGISGEGLTSIPNHDGTGYWVLTSQNNSPNIHAFYFDGDGPADPDGDGPLGVGDPVTSVMPTNNLARYSSFVFSADRTQLVQTSTGTGTATSASIIRRLDFDAETGQISQIAEWSAPTTANSGDNLYGADFSPSGRYLYITKLFGTATVYRYDLQADDVAGSVETVGLLGSGGAIRRGPDGRMYIARNNTSQLGVIDDPDAEDVADVGFAQTGLTLATGASSRFGLPQMVTGCPNTPELSIDKSSDLTTDTDGDGAADVGDVITYTFRVRNTGTVDLTDIVPVDSRLADADFTPVDLAFGSYHDFTATYTVTQADVDAGVLTNTAHATGTYTPAGGGTPETITSADDTDTFVDLPARVPGLSIVKEGEITTDGGTAGVADIGDVITYTFTVVNTGNVTMTDVTIDDPRVASVSPSSATLPPGTTPASTQEFTATYTVVEADILAGGVHNQAQATATSPTGAYTSDYADEDVDTPEIDQELTVEKSSELTTDADGDGAADVGDVLSYTITVTNTGNTTLTGVTASDPLLGSTLTPTAPVDLAPGDGQEFTGTYTVTQTDIDNGLLRNTATASGTFTPTDGGTPLTITGEDYDDADLQEQQPGLTVEKHADLDDLNGNGTADAGETIAYSFTVTNTGNTTMEDVEVVDPRVTGLAPLSTPLAPGETAELQADPYTVTEADVQAGGVVNSATARGHVPGGPETISEPDEVTTATTPIPDPPAPAEESAGIASLLPSTGTAVTLLTLFTILMALATGAVFWRRGRQMR
ncbi:MAG: hypothetical protein QM621_04005 [Aeromicrobium sp.]|uniref:DUF7507 domain-containing protein n=1 Tax=Aeromicrobium sp. TaxID=1871063 RepID=UPI0039E6AF7D